MLTGNNKAAAHMVSILSMEGHKLIPKTPINSTMSLPNPESRTLDIEELLALGERHLGCGHDL